MTRYVPAFPKPIRAVPIENAEKYRTAFEARTERTDSCWLWRGFISNQGYGRTVWSDKTPEKVSLICLDCSSSGVTAYAAYGDGTKSWGLWLAKPPKPT